MNDKGMLERNQNICRIFTTIEQKLCTTFCELIGIVKSIKQNQFIIIGSDQFIKVLNEHKLNPSCLIKKVKLPLRTNQYN